jgi:hypothetical protein
MGRGEAGAVSISMHLANGPGALAARG